MEVWFHQCWKNPTEKETKLKPYFLFSFWHCEVRLILIRWKLVEPICAFNFKYDHSSFVHFYFSVPKDKTLSRSHTHTHAHTHTHTLKKIHTNTLTHTHHGIVLSLSWVLVLSIGWCCNNCWRFEGSHELRATKRERSARSSSSSLQQPNIPKKTKKFRHVNMRMKILVSFKIRYFLQCFIVSS